jgi:CRISPR-associated protein Cmr5
MKTRNQEMASDVFERVKHIENNPKKKQYGSMAHKLPVLIQTAGLAQALSFVDAKSKSPSGKILGMLLNDLAQTLKIQNAQELVSRSRDAGLSEYMHLTKRCLFALLWYKRFAQSVLGIEAGESEEL